MEKLFINIIAGICVAAGCLLSSEAFADFSPQVIKIYDESELDRLDSIGAKILRRRGDILLCLIPADNGNEIVIPNSSRKIPMPGSGRGRRVNKPAPGKFNVPALDVAVSHFDAAGIITGEGWDHPYTGKNVVVGICDIGFDPLHPTFLDNNGNSRVRRITCYKETEGISTTLEGDEQYREWETDDRDNFHATHVCGILAGNGAGTPYVGIARDADIVVSTSYLSDVGLLAGVEDIIDYAQEAGKPAVINLSMGNYTGPHDGTSLFSQYLDMCSDDAIIVLSSGNEGAKANTLSACFSKDTPDIGFRLGNTAWNQIDMYGITDIWSDSSSPLSVEISIYDEQMNRIAHSYPPFNISGGEVAKIEWDGSSRTSGEYPLDGYLIAKGGIDPENGRYNVMLMYDYNSPQLTEGGWARYVVAVKVSGSAGTCADIFADGRYTRLMSLSGYPAPGSLMSVSDLACGWRVISVGMYGNRSVFPVSVRNDDSGSWTTSSRDSGTQEMSTVSHSSYGTLRDSRILPLTTAPGNPLVSAMSRPFLRSHSGTECLRLDSPWIAEGGTSMASPFVAGFIATWLEADPTLSAEDAQRLIAASNITGIPETDDPRNANGWFNPAGALKAVINQASLNEIKNHPLAFGPEDDVDIFSISGSAVYSGRASGCPVLPAGTYIITSTGRRPVKTISDGSRSVMQHFSL